MKERITYIHRADDPFEPSQLSVGEGSLDISNLRAARDHQLTFDLEELPKEIVSFLSQVRGFRIRWSSTQQSTLSSPFNSRISPGLHVYLTLLDATPEDGVYIAIKELFGVTLNHASVKGSITPRNHGNSESPGATLLSYYQSLESLGDVAAYIQERYCASDVADCKLSLKHLQAAESLDIDYDASSRNFILRAYQSRSPSASVGWSTSEQALEPGRTEIGVLAAGDATIRDHLKFGGYLVVLRDEKKLKPTLFQFPSRHHGPPSLNSTYKISFPKPSGLHPTLQIEMNPGTLTRPRTTDPDSCTLHSYLTLPSAIFPDKYQLSNELLLQSLNIRRIQSISGYTDLEAPDYAVSSWGSSMLVELEVLSDETRKADNSWHANTPLHLRYLLPNNSKSGISSIEVPWPVVFWACTADDETGNFTRNPFDRTHLGYDVHFSEKTVFYHLQPESEDGRLMSILHVPVLNTGILGEDTRILELGTSFVVLTGWIWIVWLLFRGWWSTKSPIRGQKKMI